MKRKLKAKNAKPLNRQEEKIGKTLITYRYGNTKAVERKGILMNMTFLCSPYRGDIEKNISLVKRAGSRDVGPGGVVHVK